MLVLAVSAVYESFFVHNGINHLDESWPLYAAMRLHAGGVLYDDTLWVFPPAHVWVGWLAYALDPPGFVLARIFYAGFSVALCGALYLLARRLMPEPFALLAALLVAVAAPRGHHYQLLFGYRYLVFSVLALLAFDRRLRGGSARWMVASGALVGVALAFRLTPAFSTSCGIAAALLASRRDWRAWLAEGSRFLLGLAVVTLPLLAWFAQSVGLPRLWNEVVLHPLLMLQPLPLPEIVAPTLWDREAIARWFVALQFRAIWVLYLGYAGSLLLLWLRARRRGQAFRHALLLAVVVSGAVFFVRSTGRSDEAHLDSVIPPVCLLVAHLSSVSFAALWPLGPGLARRAVAGAGCAAALAAWIFLLATDFRLEQLPTAHDHPIRVLGGRVRTLPLKARQIDSITRLLLRETAPDDWILNLAHTPVFHVLTGRFGPGYFDVVMPGTFPREQDEIWFLERLRSHPPAAVVWPERAFDGMPSRSIAQTAPRVSEWVRENYRPTRHTTGRWIVLLPRAGLRPVPTPDGRQGGPGDDRGS